MPQSVKDATLAYHRENDKVGLFIDECPVEDGSCEERTSDIYYAYQDWFRENGYYPENAKNFKAALANAGNIVRKRPRGGGEKTTVFIGYKLLRGTEFLFYMTVHDNGTIRVHATKPYDFGRLEALKVRCPKCASQMIPIHSSFNNDETQAFRCIICKK